MGRVLQVVGYQNSGKTTFVVDYIKAAVKQNLKVGTIKHHGHPGAITYGDKLKDTGKHRHAGAHVSVVEGNSSFVLTAEKISLSLDQLLSLYRHFQLDIIVVEGYKTATYPKVVLIRTLEDLPMLNDLLNVTCIVASFELPKDVTERFTTFYQPKVCIEWLLKGKVGGKIE